jgi:hypothetical protein
MPQFRWKCLPRCVVPTESGSCKSFVEEITVGRDEKQAQGAARRAFLSVPAGMFHVSDRVPQFDWVQEFQRLNAEEAMIEKDLMHFASQAEADVDSGDRLLSAAEIKLSHKAQLAMFKAQLGAIKLLISFHGGKGEASDGKMADSGGEADSDAFQRRTALLRAGGILEELSAFMTRISDQLSAEEAELSRQVRRLVLD